MKFSAVILAGGKSSRMGRDKAGLPLGGQSLLERQVSLVRELGAAEIFLAAGNNDYSLANCRTLHDNVANCGPLAGIEAALAATSSPLLLVLAVDLPQMSRNTLNWLLGHCGENTGAIPRINDNIEPLIAIYPRAAHQELHDALVTNRYAVQDFARACVAQGRVRWVDVPADHRDSFANCNTPQEWEALTKHA